MEHIRKPTNKSDHEAQYENVIAWLVKCAAPSDILGYVGDLYKMDAEVKNLAMIIRQLTVIIQRREPENKIAKSTVKYLSDHDLMGSI